MFFDAKNVGHEECDYENTNDKMNIVTVRISDEESIINSELSMWFLNI